MPIFPYRPCDPKRDPLSCFIFPDILNRVDQVMPPIVSEAAQNTVPPQRSYDMQFVINPAAGGGRVGGLIKKFERRSSIEPYLRVLGNPIQTSHSVESMVTTFSDVRNNRSWGSPVYLPILSGDSGTSKAMDALSRLSDKPNSSVIVVPVNGVGTARDIPRAAGALSFTERLPHALMRSVAVPYYGLDATGEVGAGRHFHSIASGIGGKLMQVVHEVVGQHPYLLSLKKVSSVFGVVPYLAAFAPIYKMVRNGDLVTEVEVTQGDQVLFRGKTCGIVTAVVPGLGSVTRISGVDPTHGQAKLLILPEDAKAALTTIFEGMWLRVKAMIPGTDIPNVISTLPLERQIVLGQNPIQLKFLTPSPLETNGDYVGEVSALTLQVAEKPSMMMVARDSLLAKLAGYQQTESTIESVLRMSEFAMLGVGIMGAVYPGLRPEEYRDLTHKMMVGMVHGTTIAIMLQQGSPFAFHMRLLNMLPAFIVMQKGAEFLPITDKKWQIFAQNYLPIAAMGVMQYFRISPTVGNVVRLMAPGTYSSIMGSRLASGMARSALGRMASGFYYSAYAAGLIVYFYQAIGDQGERNHTVSSWLESTLYSDTSADLVDWERDQLKRLDLAPQTIDAMTALLQLPGDEVEASLKQSMPSEDWTRLDVLAEHLRRLDLGAAQADAKRIFDRGTSPSEITARAWMMAAHVDPDHAYWSRALLRSVMHHDYEIVFAAENPGLFVLAATLAFHRRHPEPKTPEPQILPQLLASLTLAHN